jgi:hypothetical protein
MFSCVVDCVEKSGIDVHEQEEKLMRFSNVESRCPLCGFSRKNNGCTEEFCCDKVEGWAHILRAEAGTDVCDVEQVVSALGLHDVPPPPVCLSDYRIR